MTVKLLAEHHFEFLRLKGGRVYTCQNATLLEISCTGSFIITVQSTGAVWANQTA